MARHSKRKRKHRQPSPGPDEVLSAGPIEIARFGRFIVGRSNLDEAGQAKLDEDLAARYPEVVAEIDAIVGGIAERVANLPPGKLLQRAFWMFAIQQIRTGGADATDPDEGTTLRMVDYVQSVIAAVPPRLPYAEDVDDDAWAALRDDVAALFRKLNLEHPICRTAWRRKQDPDLDSDLEAFQVRAEMLWANVRGVRHQTEERQALAEVLEPHSEILQRLFGLDAASLAAEAEKIQTALTHGLMNIMEDFEGLRQETLKRFAATSPDGRRALAKPADIFQQNPELERRMRDVMGRFVGLDLFDVKKACALPDALLEPLSWAPGEDESFFAPGQQRGWPLRVWPTMRRPFLRIDGRILCFDRYALFDNLYRAIQRVVLQLAPEYRRGWNEGQQAVSEALPFRCLEDLFPGAEAVRPVYYPWSPTGGRADWHEADGLLVCDDHLFVVEVKAGAFTWTSPTTDLEAHLKSLTGLVQAPALQGSRFVDYLRSTPEAVLYDSGHAETGRIRLSDYRHVTTCIVTLDPFTESAARAQHLRSVGVDVGERPVWVVSVDDLRVYAQVLREPLRFLHFVEQRLEAARSDLVDLDDELDHLGMYLRENQYGRYARDLTAAGGGKPRFTGYRSVVDDFFAAKVFGEEPEPLSQPLPARVAEVISFLEASDLPGRSRIASFLLDAAGSERERLHRSIGSAIDEQRAGAGSRAVSSYGEQAFTLQVWTPAAPRDAAAALALVHAVLAAAGEQSRLLLELTYDADDRLSAVDWRFVGIEGLPEDELAKIYASGETLKRARVARARARGWIRPKMRCPCGSGLQYRHCHG